MNEDLGQEWTPERIVWLRGLYGWSQRTTAKAIGASFSAVSGWETGYRPRGYLSERLDLLLWGWKLHCERDFWHVRKGRDQKQLWHRKQSDGSTEQVIGHLFEGRFIPEASILLSD